MGNFFQEDSNIVIDLASHLDVISYYQTLWDSESSKAFSGSKVCELQDGFLCQSRCLKNQNKSYVWSGDST